MAEFQQITGKKGPQMRLFMEIPTRPAEIAQPRVWNKMVKDSVRKALMYHHNNHMPLHFLPAAKGKYGHKTRSEKYRAYKARRWRSNVDLVMTGRTRAVMTKHSAPQKIQVGGAAEGGKKPIAGKLIYVFGFNAELVAFYKAQKAGKTRDPTAARAGGVRIRIVNPNRVTMADMKKELQTITEDEATALQTVFADDLMAQIEAYKSKRKRIRA